MTRDIRRTEARLPDYTREGWSAGPWDDEPDLIEWRSDDFPALALLAVRSHATGALCGYVGVPAGHPLHGKGHDDIDFDAHGGLTYSGACAGHICHVPAPGEPDDVWWLGFDCGHAFDVSPGLDALIRKHSAGAFFKFDYATYKALDYVMAEVEGLARQVG